MKGRKMREPLATASISIDKSSDGYDWRGYGKYTEGHGFDIDVLRRPAIQGAKFERVAMRNAAWPTHGEGDRDVALVSDTIDAVMAGKTPGNTLIFNLNT